MDDQQEPEAVASKRLCPHCSAISETEGEFCPRCGGSLLRGSRRLSRRTTTILAAALLALLVAGGASALVVKHNRDASHRRLAAAQTAAAEAKRSETAVQIAARHASEREMQASITKWARKLAASGSLDGPILRTSCQPVGGGSENLSEITVKYDCLSVDKDNADGSSSGYAVHATMAFSTGQYQWGLGDG
jgi:predicted nucleic acid-binding Zn ribbon protein